MARVSKVDSCLICGMTPCDCRRVGKPNLTPVAEPAPDVRTPIKLIIPRLRPKPTAAPKVHTANSSIVAEEDLVLIAALRNIEPIMGDTSRAEFQSLLMSAETPEERAAFWKARRDYVRA